MDSETTLSTLRDHIQRRERTPWRPEYCDLIIALSESNPDFRATTRQIAEFLGCTERAVYKWRAEHPEFEAAYQSARQVAVDRSLEGLFEAAVGAVSQTQKRTTRPDGTVVTEVTVRRDPPNVQAAMFLLKNLRPDEWKDRRDIDVVSEGEPVRPIIMFAESKSRNRIVDVTPSEGEND